MKLKAIPYQSGYIFVDESGSDFKVDDIVYDIINQLVTSKIKKEMAVFFNQVKERNQYFKIIAQHTLNLEGIPYVELEENEARRYVASILGEHNLDNSTGKMMIECYKSAQPKKYTEEQVRDAIEMAQEQKSVRYSPNEYEFKYTPDQIIQSLQPKIESIEVEADDSIFRDPQIFTYQKDGKTYLRIKKISYETNTKQQS